MADAFDSHPRNFGTLLGKFTNPVVVPAFQRGYSWEKSHVSTFCDDIQEFRQDAKAGEQYFLGPIVIITETGKTQLLDGQQRLATATIFFSVLRDIARTFGTTQGNDFARDVQRDLIERDDGFSLKLGETDELYFRKAVQSDPPQNEKALLRSHVLIKTARDYIRSVVSKQIEGKSPAESLTTLKKLQKTLASDVVVVAISVDSEDDAFQIFETLNDRGLRLTVPDLLLNHLMRAATAAKRTHIRDKWNYMLDKMARRDIDRFLRHMWLSRFGDVKTRGLYREIKRHIAEHELEPAQFADDCAEECDNYVAIVDVDAEVLGKAAAKYVSALVDYLDASTSLPLLLSSIRVLKPAEFEKLAKAATSLVVRYDIANLNPATLEETMYKAARELRLAAAEGETSAKAYHRARAILAAIDATDDQVKTGIADLTLSKKQAQFIVTTLANRLQSSTKEIAISEGTIEHIFPQNAGGDWPNKADLEPYIWHLGNLTVLGAKPNKDAANSAFAEKISKHYSKSEIKLSKNIGTNYKQWGVAEVVKRATLELAPMVLQAFPKL